MALKSPCSFCSRTRACRTSNGAAACLHFPPVAAVLAPGSPVFDLPDRARGVAENGERIGGIFDGTEIAVFLLLEGVEQSFNGNSAPSGAP